MSDFVLYNYFRSSTSYRARIALHLKNIPFEYRPVHLVRNGGEQFSAGYRKLNPSSEVPTLVHQGRAIGQSMAIVEYLDEIAPTPRLFPEDPYMKAKVRQFCEVINSGMHSYQNLKTLRYLQNELGVSEDKKMAWISHWLQAGFRSLENLLGRYSGTYCFGDSITAADVFLAPQVFSAHRFKVPMDEFRHCTEIARRCESLPAFQKAHPSRQPDYQP